MNECDLKDSYLLCTYTNVLTQIQGIKKVGKTTYCILPTVKTMHFSAFCYSRQIKNQLAKKKLRQIDDALVKNKSYLRQLSARGVSQGNKNLQWLSQQFFLCLRKRQKLIAESCYTKGWEAAVATIKTQQ